MTMWRIELEQPQMELLSAIMEAAVEYGDGVPENSETATILLRDTIEEAEEWSDWRELWSVFNMLRQGGSPLGLKWRRGIGCKFSGADGYLHHGWHKTEREAITWLWNECLCKATLPPAVRQFVATQEEEDTI